MPPRRAAASAAAPRRRRGRREASPAPPPAESESDSSSDSDAAGGATGASLTRATTSRGAGSGASSTAASGIARQRRRRSSPAARSRPNAKESARPLREVEQQIEAHHDRSTIWNSVMRGDASRVDELLARDPGLIDARGPVGETPLLMCFVYRQLDLARSLSERFEGSLAAQYEGDEYHGENALHISIVNRDVDSVRLCLEREPSLMDDAADGRFFSRGQPCYYGEYAVCFAACTNQPRVLDLLLEAGADLATTDSNGNTMLHLCVLHGLPEMFQHVATRWKDAHGDGSAAGASDDGSSSSGGGGGGGGGGVTPLWKRENADGLTPLTLAARDGLKDMFVFLVEWSSRVLWAYGPVKCVLIPLENLDLIPGRPMGAIEWIVEKEHVDMLTVPRVAELLDAKWAAFGERYFHRSFYLTMAYVAAFVATIVMRNPDFDANTVCASAASEVACRATAFAAPSLLSVAPAAEGGAVLTVATASLRDAVAVAAELVVLLGALAKGRREVGELAQEGFRGYFGGRGAAAIENMGSVTYIGLLLCIAGMRAAGAITWAIPALQVVCIAVLTVYAFYFMLGFRLTGVFVVMIASMITSDLARFSAILAVFLVGYASASSVIFNDTGFVSFGQGLLRGLSTLLGDVQAERYAANEAHPYLSLALMTLSVVLMSVLLINLLIASMGDTFARLSSLSHKVWRLQRARIQFAIETEMDAAERSDPRNKYWSDLGGGERYLQVQEVDERHFRKGNPYLRDGKLEGLPGEHGFAGVARV